jgi:hypothetical protein
VCEAVMTNEDNVFYESEDLYYNESPQSIYVVDMIKSLGYKVEAYTSLDRYNNREMGIIISW